MVKLKVFVGKTEELEDAANEFLEQLPEDQTLLDVKYTESTASPIDPGTLILVYGDKEANSLQGIRKEMQDLKSFFRAIYKTMDIKL